MGMRVPSNGLGHVAVDEGPQVERELRRLTLIVFITAVVATSIPGAIYVIAGRLGVVSFLIALAIYTVLIAAVVLMAYAYTHRLWQRNLDERMRMEEQVRRSEERLKTLFESSADGIFYTDNDGHILECNSAFVEMLGYTRDELKGITYQQLTPGDWHQVDSDVIESQLKNSGYSDEYMKEYMTRDGVRIPVATRVWVFNDRSGEPEGAWAMVRNLSERIQYESFMRETIIRLEEANDRLQELDRLKTELVAMVSHELRAPLGAIESSLNAMRVLKDGSSPDEQEELIRILDRGVRRLSRLVDDLMDITRIESGQLKLEPRPVDAADLAGRVVTSFEGLFADKGIDIAFERPAGACMALCDPGRIEQVLTNLIANALKFTDEGGVVVSIDSTPGDTMFCVADSGPGLPSELHQKVFEKFFSLDLSSTDGKQGVGLGLAISKGIVEAHDGHIWVESGTGAGAKFCFEIPGDPDS